MLLIVVRPASFLVLRETLVCVCVCARPVIVTLGTKPDMGGRSPLSDLESRPIHQLLLFSILLLLSVVFSPPL